MTPLFSLTVKSQAGTTVATGVVARVRPVVPLVSGDLPLGFSEQATHFAMFLASDAAYLVPSHVVTDGTTAWRLLREVNVGPGLGAGRRWWELEEENRG